MKNGTNIKIPKKYQAAVKEIYKDEDGYWCVLNDGWYADDGSGDTEHRTVNGENQKQLLEAMSDIKQL